MPTSGGVIPGFDLESDPLISVAQTLITANTAYGPAYVGNWEHIELRIQGNLPAQGATRGILVSVEWANDPADFGTSVVNVTARRIHLPATEPFSASVMSPIARLRLPNMARWVRIVAVPQTPGLNHSFQVLAFGSNRDGAPEQYPQDNAIVNLNTAGAGTTNVILPEIISGTYSTKAIANGGTGSFVVYGVGYKGGFDDVVTLIGSNLAASLHYPDDLGESAPGFGQYTAPLMPQFISLVAPTGSRLSIIWHAY